MTAERPAFGPIEIDSIDDALADTARRKRIPSLRLDPATPDDTGPATKSEKLGGEKRTARADENAGGGAASGTSGGASGSEPARRPGEEGGREVTPKVAARPSRRRPLSLEVPDDLARELKVKAATQGVTVRYLILSALAGAGYPVAADELEEDGRRLR